MDNNVDKTSSVTKPAEASINGEKVTPTIVEEPKKKSKGKGCLIAFFVIVGIVFTMVVCSLAFGMFAYAVSGTSGINIPETEIYSGTSYNKIAIIDVAGVIWEFEGDSVTAPGASPTLISAALNQAIEDDSVVGIILRIESPGGDAIASDLIYQEVMAARREKPVVAYTSNMAASGGYYVAAAADEIIMHPMAITGSIGVIMEFTSWEGFYEKLGVETITYTSGEFKTNDDIYAEEETELDDVYQTMVNETYDMFVDSVVKGRGMDEDEVRELGDGRVYTANQAVDNGLIDDTGYFEDAIFEIEDMVDEDDLTLVEYDVSYDTNSWLGIKTFFEGIGASKEAKVGPRLLYIVH